MLGLDDWIASLSTDGGVLLLLAVAVALGLRHATDPDHLAAVAALVARDGERPAGRGARLGLCWGAGHAASLFLLGAPVVLYRAYLPEALQHGAELAVGVVICALGLSLLRRRRRDRCIRTPRRAVAIGLLHGTAGSAGVGVLLLATIGSGWTAVGGLALFAACTALSMAFVSSGLGNLLGARRVQTLLPGVAAATLAFGAWYTLQAASAF